MSQSAYYITADLGLELADPLTVQAFETTNVNSNFELLEAGIVADRVRLTATEADVTALEAQHAIVGTVTQFTVASLAALDALATAVVGDEAVFSAAPSTGITFEGLKAQAISGSGATIDWRFVSNIEAATKANLDTFIAAVVAITDLAAGFKLGGMAYISGTRQFVRFTTTAGAYNFLNGLVPIVPTSVAGTGVTLGANGAVTIATGGITASVNGCFTSDFDHYLILASFTNSGNILMGMRFRLSGTDATGASDYVYETVSKVGATLTGVATTGSSAPVSVVTTADTRMHIEVFSPALAANTWYQGRTAASNAAAAASGEIDGRHIQAVAYDGVTFFLASGTITAAIIRIYGYNNN